MGWAYAAAVIGARAHSGRRRRRPTRTRCTCCLAICWRSASAMPWASSSSPLVIGLAHLLFSRRFLLVTFDAEAAQVAGVNARLWSLGLNLLVGVAAAAAVHEIGALLTFALLTLPAMAALLVTTNIRATFTTAAGLGATAAVSGPCGFVLLRPASRSGIGRPSIRQRAGGGCRELRFFFGMRHSGSTVSTRR